MSFFAIIHLPVHEHRPLLERCFTWVQPGGYLLATVGHQAWTGYKDEWYGAPMYWSHADEATYLTWFQELGFTLLWTRFIPEGDGGHAVSMRASSGAVAYPSGLKKRLYRRLPHARRPRSRSRGSNPCCVVLAQRYRRITVIVESTGIGRGINSDQRPFASLAQRREYPQPGEHGCAADAAAVLQPILHSESLATAM